MRFILFDRIVELQKGRAAVLIKNVSQSEDYFTDHFPGYPIVPGSIILGSFEQGAEILLAASFDFSLLPALKSLSKVSLRRFVVPGDQIEITLTMDAALPTRETKGSGVLTPRLPTPLAPREMSRTVKALGKVQGRRVADARLDFSLEQTAGKPELVATCERLRRLYELMTSSPVTNVWGLWEGQSSVK